MPQPDVARANELESIFYSKIVDVQEELNKVITLVKLSRETGLNNGWNTMIQKYSKLVEMEATARLILTALDYDLNHPLGSEPWRNCGDG